MIKISINGVECDFPDKIVSIDRVGGSVIINGKIVSSHNVGEQVQVVIHGGVTGDLTVHHGSVTCENVGGSVKAGGSVKCASVDGNVSSGGSATCADVKGSVSAGGSLRCGKIGGSVSAGGSVRHG